MAIGQHHSEEHKKKISIALLGRKKPPFSEEHKKNMSRVKLGRLLSKEHKQKIRDAHIGITMPYKGQPWSDARRKAHKPKIHKGRYTSHGKEYTLTWLELRKDIYARDNWICQECSIKCHGNGTKDKIQCHHIDYDINNNSRNNLITLCSSCHCKTNFKRKDWMEYFKHKMGGE